MHNRLLSGLAVSTLALAMWAVAQEQPQQQQPIRRPDGGTSITAVIRELIAGPSQLSGLLRIAFDAYAARRALLRARELLGPDFGLIGLNEA